jgi:hypothetical protein
MDGSQNVRPSGKRTRAVSALPAMMAPLAVIAALAAPGIADPPPPGKAVKILSPRFFPGWQARDVCHPFLVLEAPGRYRMYYSGSGAERHNESVWDQWVTGLVTSSDTLAWKFPENYEQVLFARKLAEGELLDPEVLASRFDSVYAIGACVIRDGAAWKAWYTGWNGRTEHDAGGLTKRVEFRIGFAESRDGLTWVKAAGPAGAGSVLGPGDPGGPDARGAAHPHVLKEGEAYRMWYEGFDGTVWRLLHADSRDGLDWTKRGLALGPGGSGSPDERGLRNPLVLLRKGRYELWYQGRSRSPERFRVLRALSADGIAWMKAAGEVALHPDPPLEGDEEVLADSALILPDGSVQVFFARQVTTMKALTYGAVMDRNFHIYTEVVNP